MNKEELVSLGQRYLQKFDLDRKGWTFEAGNFFSFWGDCDESKKVIRVSKVLAQIANTNDIVDTILHEIAHALVGTEHGHNKVWKTKAKEIGATPVAELPWDEDIDRKLMILTAKYVVLCNGKIVTWYSKDVPRVRTTIKKRYAGNDLKTMGQLVWVKFNMDVHKHMPFWK